MVKEWKTEYCSIELKLQYGCEIVVLYIYIWMCTEIKYKSRVYGCIPYFRLLAGRNKQVLK
jgi:hypothetical protein